MDAGYWRYLEEFANPRKNIEQLEREVSYWHNWALRATGIAIGLGIALGYMIWMASI